MFAFPQLYGQYQNMAIVDLAPSGFGTDMDGNASLIWGGEKHTFRFSTGRSDLTARTALFSWGGFDRVPTFGTLSGGLFDAADQARNFQFWDLGWATTWGGKPIGLAFSWVSDTNSFDDGAGTTDPDDSFDNFGLSGLFFCNLFRGRLLFDFFLIF